MFWTVAYLCVSYGCVCAFLFALSRSNAFRRIKVVWFAVTFAVALVPLIPYARVAVQTARYGKELESALHATKETMAVMEPSDTFSILRVLDITATEAELYLADESGGYVVRFVRRANKWAYKDDDVVWSNRGSAEGNTFPPYPEARSF